jgi:hypothetical protein
MVFLPLGTHLYKEFVQEGSYPSLTSYGRESRLISHKQKVDDEENQTFAAHVKKRKEREEGGPRKSKNLHHKRDTSKVQCFNCRKMGHYDAQCPHKHEKEKKKHHAHVANDEEHKPKDEEFVFISALTRTITQGSDTWLIDSGASKHMTGFRNSL